MTDKARELLERTLKQLNPWHPGMGEQQFDYTLREEIRAYLAEQKQYDALADRYVEGVAGGIEKYKAYFEGETAKISDLLFAGPKVPFVRLTEEELKECWGFPYSLSTDELRRFARAIETKLMEKNK